MLHLFFPQDCVVVCDWDQVRNTVPGCAYDSIKNSIFKASGLFASGQLGC